MPLVAQNDSGQDGEATLSEVDSDTTRVVLEVENPSVEPQPAHIHRGSCENLDPQPAYPLENVVDGKSTNEVNVAVEDLVDKDSRSTCTSRLTRCRSTSPAATSRTSPR